MGTPMQEKEQFSFPAFQPSNPPNPTHERRSSD